MRRGPSDKIRKEKKASKRAAGVNSAVAERHLIGLHSKEKNVEYMGNK